MKGKAAPNYRKGKRKKVENDLNLDTQNQTFKQLRQLNDRNHHIPIMLVSGGSCLLTNLLRRQRLVGSWFETNLGKKVMQHHLRQ
jgi:hypothetical protein